MLYCQRVLIFPNFPWGFQPLNLRIAVKFVEVYGYCNPQNGNPAIARNRNMALFGGGFDLWEEYPHFAKLLDTISIHFIST